MAFKRLSMRKIHRVLRLFFEAGLSIRAIARSIQASPSTVGEYIRRANTAGLSWPLPETLDERALEGRLFPTAVVSARVERPIPDWARVHAEHRRKGVTLALLWQEYKAEHPEGLQYSQFCERYRRWRGRLDVVMRQSHRAGEKLFVDCAGHSVPVVERQTGELRNAQIFVAVLGASNYTFAEATWTQTLPDWCASHVRALSFLTGVPEIVVPDNLRSAITRPHRFEPDVHPTYTDLAEHYGFAIVPARVHRPRDKAKVAPRGRGVAHRAQDRATRTVGQSPHRRRPRPRHRPPARPLDGAPAALARRPARRSPRRPRRHRPATLRLPRRRRAVDERCHARTEGARRAPAQKILPHRVHRRCHPRHPLRAKPPCADTSPQPCIPACIGWATSPSRPAVLDMYKAIAWELALPTANSTTARSPRRRLAARCPAPARREDGRARIAGARPSRAEPVNRDTSRPWPAPPTIDEPATVARPVYRRKDVLREALTIEPRS